MTIFFAHVGMGGNPLLSTERVKATVYSFFIHTALYGGSPIEPYQTHILSPTHSLTHSEYKMN